eukprot:1513501-Pyramimonas_sp.AAC.1
MQYDLQQLQARARQVSSLSTDIVTLAVSSRATSVLIAPAPSRPDPPAERADGQGGPSNR